MIIDELLKIQKDRRLTGKQMAESLGIHSKSWSRNKKTKVISAEVLLKAFELYPELSDVFLSSFPTEKAQDKNIGLLKGLLVSIYQRLKGGG